MTARELLADDVKILKRETNAPNVSLQELVKKNKEKYDYEKRN